MQPLLYMDEQVTIHLRCSIQVLVQVVALGDRVNRYTVETSSEEQRTRYAGDGTTTSQPKLPVQQMGAISGDTNILMVPGPERVPRNASQHGASNAGMRTHVTVGSRRSGHQPLMTRRRQPRQLMPQMAPRRRSSIRCVSAVEASIACWRVPSSRMKCAGR